MALDYEIKDNPRQVGSVSVVPTYTNYKIFFTYKIRNGNCIVYPFEANTGAELSDNSITENGFKLDMAKSKYLTINVIKSVLRVGKDGTLTEDVRFNGPVKDGEDFTDEGIYTFTVKNLYKGGEPTTKTIYVGANKYLLLLSKSGLSVAEVNKKIALGAEVAYDGSIVEPVAETEVSIEEESEKQSEETVTDDEVLASGGAVTENDIAQENTSRMPIVTIGIIAVLCVALVYVFTKRKSDKKSKEKDGSK